MMPSDLAPLQLDWVERTLASLSLREKIGQTVQERWTSRDDNSHEAIADHFTRYPIGSLFCGGDIIKGAEGTAAVFRESLQLCQRTSKVPLLVAGDLETGAGGAVCGLTRFPPPLALGACDDEELAYNYGKFTALEGRMAGFHWTFAPVADLSRNWLNPVLSTRSFGDDPERVVRLASAVSRGLQDHHFAACAKHFPGDGVDFRDQHLVTSVNSLTEEAWGKQDGTVFGAMIAAGVFSIMCGHIALPWCEPLAPEQRRPRPATVSRRLLTVLLREQMGFRGVIVSDALEMGGFTGWAPYAERMIEAFNAGIDVMLWPSEAYFPIMERALDEGKVSLQRLDESVYRVLTLKALLGLNEFDAEGRDPHVPPLEEGRIPASITNQALTIADRIAEGSITLVRNRRDRLPLDPSTTKRILLQTAVASSTWHDSLDDLVDTLRARGVDLTILKNGNCLDVWRREKGGQRWDAYLVVFSQQVHQMKNTMRPVGAAGEVMWTLQNTDTLHPIVVSLGTPFLLRDMPFLDTLVNGYSPGKVSVQALVKALFGELPFVGVSPVEVGGTWF
jgi:beta-N-acetylhexosaminidase